MNEKPHTHEPQLKRNYRKSRWDLVYGDTTVRVKLGTTNPPSARKVKKALKKAVKQHDFGSKQAGRREEMLQAAREAAMLPVTEEAWGEDLLSGKVTVEVTDPALSKEEQKKALLDARKKQQEERREREYQQEQARFAQAREIRAEQWKEGRPDKKVRMDGFGNVLADQGDGSFEYPYTFLQIESSDY